MMSSKIVLRGVAYLVLAVALLAAAITLNNRRYPPTSSLEAAPSSATDNLDAELARCTALGTEAANDAGCKAVWQASRERFLNANKLYQNRVPDSLPLASNAGEPAPALGKPLSSPSTRAGQPQ
jgi:conjugative transfer region protein TrbK